VIVERKIRVRTPSSPEPLVLSASLMYVLPALSVTETLELDGSMATVTKTVSPKGTVAETTRVVSRVSSLSTTPTFIGDGVVLSSVKVTAAPAELLPTLSVAIACTVYRPSACEAHAGNVALLVHTAVELLFVAVCVVAR